MNGRVWSETERSELAALYPVKPTAQVALALGRGLSGVYRMAAMLGLKKTEDFLASEESGRLRKGHADRGIAGRFPKGHAPANKGLRRPGWSPGRMKDTQFRKGCRSGAAARNWVPIGTVLPDADGYLRVKVREAVHGSEATGFGNSKVWPFLSRLTWEKHRGPIPPKHIITFKDGDRKNCGIENLELISMADNARRNGMWRHLPRELAEVIQLGGVLKRAIRRRDGEEQN